MSEELIDIKIQFKPLITSEVFLFIRSLKLWSLRLSVRTLGFHPRKRGSIPLGTTKNLSRG